MTEWHRQCPNGGKEKSTYLENVGEIMTVLYVCKLMEFSLDLEVLTISLCTKKIKLISLGHILLPSLLIKSWGCQFLTESVVS